MGCGVVVAVITTLITTTHTLPSPTCDTIKLRETPKAPATKPGPRRRLVARVMTSGTVTTLEMSQWAIRSQVLIRIVFRLPACLFLSRHAGRSTTVRVDAVHRLNGGGRRGAGCAKSAPPSADA
jgi:hypothetical protein